VIEIQRKIALEVVLEDSLDLERIQIVAGCDMSFSKGSGKGFAAVCLFRFPDLELIETATAVGDVDFPYIPGLLSFREVPLLAEAYRNLRHKPNVLICDGQGYAHPRRLGLACHLGIELDIPTAGAAKSRLVGEYEEPGQVKGSSSALTHGEEIIGAVLRTRDGVKPIFVSPGHKMNFSTAVALVLACSPKYRIPEPTRLADMKVAELKRNWLREREDIT